MLRNNQFLSLIFLILISSFSIGQDCNVEVSKSIEKILDIVCNGIQESLDERKKEKEIAEQKKLEEDAKEGDDTETSEEE